MEKKAPADQVTAVTVEIRIRRRENVAKMTVTVKTVTERPKRRETMAGSRLADLSFRFGRSAMVFTVLAPLATFSRRSCQNVFAFCLRVLT